MYYNLLPQIKNAIMAGKDKISVPFSKMDLAVLNVLAESGYIKSADKDTVRGKQCIAIKLAFGNNKSPMNDFKFVSKPSRRFYVDYKSLKPVKQGHGLAVLSTSAGIISGKDARKKRVGGEYLFEIW